MATIGLRDMSLGGAEMGLLNERTRILALEGVQPAYNGGEKAAA